MSANTTDTDSTALETIAGADVWGAVLDRIQPIADECVLEFDADGIRTEVVDPGYVAMVDLSISPQAFESYESDGFRTGIDLETFGDVLGLAGSNELVEVTFDLETRCFTVSGDGFEYELAAISPEHMSDQDTPDEIPTDVHVDVGAERLGRAVDGSEMVSDHVTVEFDPADDTFCAFADGNTDEARFDWGADELGGIHDTPESPVEAMYSLEYFGRIVGALDSDGEASVRYAAEQPATIAQDFADGEGAAEWVIAPRITSD